MPRITKWRAQTLTAFHLIKRVRTEESLGFTETHDSRGFLLEASDGHKVHVVGAHWLRDPVVRAGAQVLMGHPGVLHRVGPFQLGIGPDLRNGRHPVDREV